MPGEPSAEEIQHHQESLKKAQEHYAQAVWKYCWGGGSFDAEQFAKLTAELKLGNEEKKKPGSPTFLKSEDVIRDQIRSLVSGQYEVVGLISEDENGLILGCITSSKGTYNTEFMSIPWQDLFTGLPGNTLKRSMALIGEYFAPWDDRGPITLTAAVDQLKIKKNAPLLICSRFVEAAHIKLVCDAMTRIGYQVSTVACKPEPGRSFQDHVCSQVQRVPLSREFALMHAEIGIDGRVTVQYETLFPAGEFIEPHSTKRVMLRSLNQVDKEVHIHVVSLDPDRKDPALYRTWGISLDQGQLMDINFQLSESRNVEVSRPVVRPVSGQNLTVILKNAERGKFSTQSSLDCVLVLDTIASPESFQQRVKKAKEILIALTERCHEWDIRFVVLAYGNQYRTLDAPRDWPTALQECDCQGLNSTHDFLDRLQRTPYEECEFESLMEDALGRLGQMDWRDGAQRVVLSLGHRPPRPFHRITGTGQLKAKMDWSPCIDKIRDAIKAVSFAVVYPIEWGSAIPVYAEPYTQEFWKKFAFTARFLGETSSTDIVSSVYSRIVLNQVKLTIPQLVHQ